jgi:hypothetical protein
MTEAHAEHQAHCMVDAARPGCREQEVKLKEASDAIAPRRAAGFDEGADGEHSWLSPAALASRGACSRICGLSGQALTNRPGSPTLPVVESADIVTGHH